jgi:replicative DNA helicase
MENRKAKSGDGKANGDRLPPHSEEAERGVLGCALQSHEAALETVTRCVEAGLSEEWFYDHRHREVWNHLARLVSAGGADFIRLQQSLKDANMLEEVGGILWLGEIQECVAGLSFLEMYLATVRERWQLRRLAATCTELAQLAMERKEDVDGLMSVAEARLTEVTTPAMRAKEQHVKELIPGVIDKLEKYHRGGTQLDGLPTGFRYLDKVIGGIAPSYYWTVAGRPGSGKTTLALDVVNHLALDYVHWEPTGELDEEGKAKMAPVTGIPVAVFSLEMSSHSLASRLVFCEARVSAGKVKQGFMSKGDFERLQVAMPRVGKGAIYIDEEPSQTIGKIRAKAVRMARQYGIKLFVLDYLQLVLPNERSSRPDRVQELTDISAQIVWLKKKLGVPWLVLAQMNRNIETAERVRIPVLSDLKDCGAIEQDADVVQFLHRPTARETEADDEQIEAKYSEVEHTERPRRVDAVVAKNRDGATGIAKLLFHANQFRFEDFRQWQLGAGAVEAGKGERMRDVEAEAMPTNEEMELGRMKDEG